MRGRDEVQRYEREEREAREVTEGIDRKATKRQRGVARRITRRSAVAAGSEPMPFRIRRLSAAAMMVEEVCLCRCCQPVGAVSGHACAADRIVLECVKGMGACQEGAAARDRGRR